MQERDHKQLQVGTYTSHIRDSAQYSISSNPNPLLTSWFTIEPIDSEGHINHYR